MKISTKNKSYLIFASSNKVLPPLTKKSIRIYYDNRTREKKKRALLDFVGEFGNGQELLKSSHQEIKASKYE